MTDPAAGYREAVAAYMRGDAARALALARQLLATLPGNAAAQALAGVAALQLGDARAAIGHLQRAEALDPARADHPAQLARAWLQAGDVQAARAAADRAVALDPSDPSTLGALGVVYARVDRPDLAVGVFRRAVALAPTDAGLHFNLATLLTFTGDLDAAINAYENCLALDPTRWPAHLALAQARRWTVDTHHQDRLRDLLARHGSEPIARLYLELALAKELEDVGEYPAAFAHLASGKAAHRVRRPYDFARDRAMFDALCQVRPADDDAPGEPCADPIFVVGMPRTGTTLVDRILSSHPGVRSAGERFDFARVLKQAAATRTPLPLDTETIRAARALDWSRVGAAYLASVRASVDGAPRFVDKLPHNFLYLAFIARALPNARIVCLRRERLDTCVANFRQLLALDSPFFDYSFDLLDIGRYVLQFERLMAHWREVLPGRTLELQYEDLVGDQAGSTRRLLEHCGLPWDDACLAFEYNPAAVATASAVQVREPLHRNSIGRWRRYAPQLAGLDALLQRGD